jgi:Ribonuclease G/E
MSDIRARRTAVLAAAAKAKSEAKAQAADQAIRRLVRRGEPVTFQAVQREAGVSHAFLYGNPDLRARIERLRAQARPQPVPPGHDNGDNTIIQALTSQISHLKKQHRDETQALRAALEQAHGENLQLRRELTRLGWNGQLAATLLRRINRNIDMTCKNVAFTSRNRG